MPYSFERYIIVLPFSRRANQPPLPHIKEYGIFVQNTVNAMCHSSATMIAPKESVWIGLKVLTVASTAPDNICIWKILGQHRTTRNSKTALPTSSGPQR